MNGLANTYLSFRCWRRNYCRRQEILSQCDIKLQRRTKKLQFWRTTSTESVSDQSKSPYIVEEGTLADPHKWATANRVKYAYLEHKKGSQRPTREPFAGIPAGAMQEALNSNDDIKATMGMFDASLGAHKAMNNQVEQSLRGKLRVIQAHSTSLITYRAIRHLGRIVVDLIPKVYTGERIIRVLGWIIKNQQTFS